MYDSAWHLHLPHDRYGSHRRYAVRVTVVDTDGEGLDELSLDVPLAKKPRWNAIFLQKRYGETKHGTFP